MRPMRSGARGTSREPGGKVIWSLARNAGAQGPELEKPSRAGLSADGRWRLGVRRDVVSTGAEADFGGIQSGYGQASTGAGLCAIRGLLHELGGPAGVDGRVRDEFQPSRHQSSNTAGARPELSEQHPDLPIRTRVCPWRSALRSSL